MHGELDVLGADDAIHDGAFLLDVREPDEFTAGHAAAAVSIPLGQLEARVAELPSGVAIICVCRSGVRSAAAADALCAAGYDAFNLLGGMLAWSSEGLPVATATGGIGSVL